MHVHCTLADPADHPRLQTLLQLYAYDFSAILPLDVADDGRFHVPAVAARLIDPRNHAFVIRVDHKLAGFALVQPGSYLTGDPSVWDMAELFVMCRYRRCGVGEQVARGLFDRFRGPWEVRQKSENQAATAFWRRIIGRYTDGQFDEQQLAARCKSQRGGQSARRRRGASVGTRAPTTQRFGPAATFATRC